MNQEQIVDNIILDTLEEKLVGSKEIILSKTTKETRRLAMLSIMDDDRKLFEQYKNIIKSEQYCSHYAEETIQVLRNYIKVADTEVKVFGEVMTPLRLVEEMLDKLPVEVWTNPNLKWLDPCNGIGTFPSVVVKRLMEGLKNHIQDDCERYRHIIENMIYVCEIQAKNMFLFHCAFDREDDHQLNTYFGSFLDKGFDEHMKNVWGIEKFDIVLGNPPYKRGFHHNFLVKGFELLNENGFILFVHPSIVFINRKGTNLTEHEAKIKTYVNEYKTDLFLFKSNDYFDVFLYVPLSITKIQNTKNKIINITNNFITPNVNETLQNIDDLFIHGNSLVKTIKIKIESKKIDCIENRLVKNAGENNFYLVIPKFTGHEPKEGSINPDFYTMIVKRNENNIERLITNDINSHLPGQYLSFNTFDNAYNTSRFLLTKFARFALSINKINQELRSKELTSVPYMDPNILWTDEMLFDYFELTQEERDYINTFIPNYYEIDFQNN
jgi:hypothetical protein